MSITNRSQLRDKFLSQILGLRRQESTFKVLFYLTPLLLIACVMMMTFGGGMGCSTLPTPKFTPSAFPHDRAFIGKVMRSYKTLGLVRAKVNYETLDPNHEEEDLCRNYFNRAVRDLVKMAQEKGADAVIDVKSVVFFENGAHEVYSTPQCSDDGMEGQVLAQGIAIKWTDRTPLTR